MRDVLPAVLRWAGEGRGCAVATVVRTWNSSPRPAGASMAVAADGEVVGSVSGGCVEGAVHTLALEVVASGQAVAVTYGVSDDEAFAVGLTCGGVLELVVAPVTADDVPLLQALQDDLTGERAAALVTVAGGAGALGARLVVGEDATAGSLGSARLDAAAADAARGLLAAGRTDVVHLGPDGERRGDELALFVESCAPPPRMHVFGAIDFAGAVVRMGKFLGFRVTVCDARPVFATAARFPDADEVVVQWPHRWLATAPVDDRTVICVLTHDPKFDVPLLEVALRTPAAYVGAMGSRRTHEARLAALREAGLTEAELARLSSPIGLDLGGRTPEETAVSIAAEVLALRWGGSGRRLSDVPGPVHTAPAHAGPAPAGPPGAAAPGGGERPGG
ncbi:XdhC family protein [Kineococcus rubinsiae]|uniref:XdhC family protein n=1 Tax=Kineococcus rubinsiae TaxID=2609562 RepID=UPI0014318478|nr:XdhC/CoxI family protein [Kineococcus rubinsiae]NIZ90556.1 XdhC family protein [Kineococcus rubinsiae]